MTQGTKVALLRAHIKMSKREERIPGRVRGGPIVQMPYCPQIKKKGEKSVV
jgi:hypothetical protein